MSTYTHECEYLLITLTYNKESTLGLIEFLRFGFVNNSMYLRWHNFVAWKITHCTYSHCNTVLYEMRVQSLFDILILILESIYNLTTISNIICVIVERFCLDANQNYFCKSNERWHAYAILLNDYFEYFKRSRILSEWLIIKHIYTSNTKYFSKLVSYDVLLTTHLYLENRSNYSCFYIVCFPFDVNGKSKSSNAVAIIG